MENTENKKNSNYPIQNYDLMWAAEDFEKSSKKFDSMWKYMPSDFSSVLDLGGGIGSMSSSMSRVHGAVGKSYHLVESSQVAVFKAQSLNLPATLCDFDLGPLPFATNSFDLVILSDVLEHMRNPWALLAEAARVSKKYVFVHGPNFASLQCRLDALAGNPIRQVVTNKNGSLVDNQGRKANHIYYITYNNLIYWGAKAGLDLLKSQAFWYRRYAPFRWILETFFKNFGEQYDVVFLKKNDSIDDLNFKFYQ